MKFDEKLKILNLVENHVILQLKWSDHVEQVMMLVGLIESFLDG